MSQYSPLILQTAFLAFLGFTAKGIPEEGRSRLLDLDLEALGSVKVDTVFAASKAMEKVTEAPSSVSIITRDEIRRFGFRTLADVLRATPGFDITYDRNYAYPGVRGINRFGDYGSKTLLLIDGHRMNDIIYESTAIGTDALLDVDLIERVEVIRGPGSAIYGSNAFSGVVHVVTRRGSAIDGIEASGAYGSFDMRSGRITYGNRWENGAELMLSGTAYASDGDDVIFYREYDARVTNRGIAHNRDRDEFWSTYGTFRYKGFTLRGGYVSREKEIPTGAYAARFNDINSTLDERGFIEASFEHITGSGWTFNARAYYDHYHYQGYINYDDGRGGADLSDDSADGAWWGAEASVSRNFGNGIRLGAGVEYRRSTLATQKNFDQESGFCYANFSNIYEVFGAYVEGSWKFAEWASVSGGLRFDHYHSFGEALTPRLGVIFHPTKNSTIKLLYGEAFRAPNVYERYYESKDTISNPALQPEKLRSYELVAEHYWEGGWRASASVFYNEVRGLIDSEALPDGRDHYINSGGADIYGFELDVERKWGRGWLARASYARHVTQDQHAARKLENTPRDTLGARILVPLLDERWSLGIEALYISDRITLQRERSGDTWLLNATLMAREIAPHLDVSLSLYNILDQRHFVPGGPEHVQDKIEQDGRTFRLKVDYRF